MVSVDATQSTNAAECTSANLNDPQMLPVGATLQGGKYTVVEQLAHGGFGKTYKVQDRDMQVYMAVKELFISGINERCSEKTSISLVPTIDTVQLQRNSNFFESQLRKFRDEARRLFKLQHPNIVRVHSYFEENNTAYYVMDYIEGESLSSRLKRLGRPLAEDEIMPILSEVFAALEYIHQQGIHHLDIKPANIMIGKDGRARLIDFGASKQVKSMDERTSTLSAMALTRGYAPPEQVAQDFDDIGPWTDFYALGATIFKLLSNIEELPSASKIQHGYDFQYPDGVSQRTRDLVCWLMQPLTTKRPQSVAEIRDFLGGKPQSKFPVNDEKTIVEQTGNQNNLSQTAKPVPHTSTSKSSASNRYKYILAICTIAVICLGTWWFWNKKSTKEEISPVENSASAPFVSKTFTINGVSFTMIGVDGGTFMMGANPGDVKDIVEREVELSPYAIGETEVTQALWEAVMGSNPSYFFGPNRPVETVSWFDCQEFISKLNELTASQRPDGFEFRLPTEAEWEFAARGGNKGKDNNYAYSGSNDIELVAWYDGNSESKGNKHPDYGTHIVKTKAPNDLGIYDMTGNVEEWCADAYISGIKTNTKSKNPYIKGAVTSKHIVRGADWKNDEGCYVTISSCKSENYYDYRNGLRLCLGIPIDSIAHANQTSKSSNENFPESAPFVSRSFKVNGISFTMIGVDGGTFMMGADDVGRSCIPLHEVELSPYAIGETEVTQALWHAVMGDNPSYFFDYERPVEQVSWEDCQAFIKNLNELTIHQRPVGFEFRLPTEAEWEFAARGGNIGKDKDYEYSGSNDIDLVAWHEDICKNVGEDHPDYGTHPVKTKRPNDLGLYDMSGNVAEWCADYYGRGDDILKLSRKDPYNFIPSSKKVARGGNWWNEPETCSVTHRDGTGNSHNTCGLRLAM